MPAARILAYPREVSIAEKFEAMVLLGVGSSRMKDFHDVWALSGAFEFRSEALTSAIDACFERRGRVRTAEAPPALTPEFYLDAVLQQRSARYRMRGGVLIAPPADFQEIGARLTAFLGFVWFGGSEGAKARVWTPQTGWSAT